jgi:hypothetical protein
MTTDYSYKSICLAGCFTTRAPLSHISESVSTTSYLVQDPILQPDGSVAEVFCYSGNAWRGQLRDHMARFTAEAAGGRLPADSFHLLFSGGRLDQAEKSVDLQGARDIRQAIPMIALLGGGIGTQLLAGRLRVFNSYPICREAKPVLPERFHEEANRTAYADCTFEKEFSRKDDSKGECGQLWMEAEAADPKVKAKPEQMRMGAELVAPGVRLYSEIHAANVSGTELGCLVMALEHFGRSPCIGGQANKGHGLVDLYYDISGHIEEESFIRIADGKVVLSRTAQDLRDDYLMKLNNGRDALRAALRCAA